MLKNTNHDLVQQLSEISDSVWRMDLYKKSAKQCVSCSKLWQALRKDYDRQIALIAAEIKKHCKEDKFS